MTQSQDTTNEKFYKIVEKEDGSKSEDEVYFRFKKRHKYKGEYMSLFQTKGDEKSIIEESLENGNMAKIFGKAGEVLFYLLFHMKYGNFVLIKQSTVAKKLNLSRQNTSKIFKKLEEANFLIKTEEGFYKFHENFVYKGKIALHKDNR